MACAAVLAVVAAASGQLAGAREDPAAASPTTTTTTVATPTTPSTSTPSTTAPTPTTPPTTDPPRGPGPTTTTTVPSLPPLPPELWGDPRAPILVDPGPGDGGEDPVDQSAFDPRSVQVDPELVAAARRSVDEARRRLEALQGRAGALAGRVLTLSSRAAELDDDVRESVEAAAAVRRRLIEHAVVAYMVGEVDQRIALVQVEDMVDLGVARSYLSAIGDTQQRLIREYERHRRDLDRQDRELAADLGEAEAELARTSAAVPLAFGELADAVAELRAYEAGAQAYVDGFVFPVAGEVEFIDSWGYPRMSGTSHAHWHQGTDIFATRGTPLLAVEDGVLDRVGVGTLGGNKLWVRGDSGTEYYYAHLAGFAAGMVEGRRVAAGEVVGFVGDTGNARGTPPHLHFEVHPGGLGPVNPYPLLSAAYGSRPLARIVEAPATPLPPPAAPVPASAAPAPAAPAPGG